MKPNIIVATDFSQRSINVIKKAFYFANNYNYQVNIVHILETSFFEKTKDIQTVYEKSLNYLQEKFPPLTKDQFYCKEDNLKNGIQHYVKELDALMIIIGSSGESDSGLRQFLGTSTKSIVRAVEIPCLVIKNDQDLHPYNNILMPTDLSSDSKRYISRVNSLLPNSNIELFNSYYVPFEGRLSFYGIGKSEAVTLVENIKNLALKNFYEFYENLEVDKNYINISSIKDGLDPESFNNRAIEYESNLIAMHTTGRFSFFAFDLLEQSNTDVLITKIS